MNWQRKLTNKRARKKLLTMTLFPYWFWVSHWKTILCHVLSSISLLSTPILCFSIQIEKQTVRYHKLDEAVNFVFYHRLYILNDISLSVFFFCVKLKSERESHFWPYLQFFSRAKIVFHAHFFPLFWNFSRPLFVFTPTFAIFFHGLKIWFHAQNFRNFHGFLYF